MKLGHAVGIGVLALTAGTWGTARELRVCWDSTPPFFSVVDGKPVGIEVDILKLFAGQRKAAFRPIPVAQFADLVPKLQAGECDVVAAIMTRTKEREQLVDFSATYFPLRMVLVQRRSGNVNRDLATLTGKKVATIKGTTYEERLRHVPGIEFVYSTTYAESAELTAAGKVDAFVCDTTLAAPLLKNHPDLEIVQVVSELEFYAFALRKGSPLKPELDALIKAIKTDGRYRGILERHLDHETAILVLSLE
jgi:ABC-type amino acid transport substrate-binding protein